MFTQSLNCVDGKDADCQRQPVSYLEGWTEILYRRN